MKDANLIELEDALGGVEALLKLIGEAYQTIVEDGHEGGAMAAGLQALRHAAVARLKTAVEDARGEIQEHRKRAKAKGNARGTIPDTQP